MHAGSSTASADPAQTGSNEGAHVADGGVAAAVAGPAPVEATHEEKVQMLKDLRKAVQSGSQRSRPASASTQDATPGKAILLRFALSSVFCQVNLRHSGCAC